MKVIWFYIHDSVYATSLNFSLFTAISIKVFQHSFFKVHLISAWMDFTTTSKPSVWCIHVSCLWFSLLLPSALLQWGSNTQIISLFFILRSLAHSLFLSLFIYLCAHARVCVHIYICLFVFMYVCFYVCVYVCVSICVYVIITVIIIIIWTLLRQALVTSV